MLNAVLRGSEGKELETKYVRVELFSQVCERHKYPGLTSWCGGSGLTSWYGELLGVSH